LSRCWRSSPCRSGNSEHSEPQPDQPAHSVVHLTYNNVFHRLTVYAASNVALAAMWIALAFESGESAL
jgi:hypothetical protein